MRRIYLFPLAACLVLAALTGCDADAGTNVHIGERHGGIKGSADIVALELALADFTRVDLAHAARGTITRGDQYRVMIRVDDNIVDHLRVNRTGVQVEGNVATLPDASADKLQIGLADGSYNNITFEVEISMPDLRALNLTGVARTELSGFAVDHAVDLEISGASNLSGEIETGPLNCQLYGASNLDLGDFSCRDADIRLSGASRGTIRATGTLDAALSGASSLGYKGNPTLGKVSTSGAASIKKQYIPSPFTYQKFKRICREWSRDRGAIQRLRSG